jgi:hypothetical protein
MPSTGSGGSWVKDQMGKEINGNIELPLISPGVMTWGLIHCLWLSQFEGKRNRTDLTQDFTI